MHGNTARVNFTEYKTATMTTTTKDANYYKTLDEVRELNIRINNQLRAAGITNHKGQLVKRLPDEPESEWKTWITELIAYRDQLAASINF